MRISQILPIVVVLLFISVQARPLDLTAPLAYGYNESSGFGPRLDVMGGAFERMHAGRDLTAPEGAEILAMAAGEVDAVWYPPGTPLSGGRISKGHPRLGGAVRIKHSESLYSMSGHMSRVIAYEGMRVWPGRVIGIIGNTGISTGRHLHVEILIEPWFKPPAPPQDPMDLFWRRMMMGFMNAEQAREATP